MNWVTLLVALGLGALWLASLMTGGASTWFTWLVFVAAVALLLNSLLGLGTSRRRLGRSV